MISPLAVPRHVPCSITNVWTASATGLPSRAAASTNDRFVLWGCTLLIGEYALLVNSLFAALDPNDNSNCLMYAFFNIEKDTEWMER